MLPWRYLCQVTVVFCAAIALSANASAHRSSTCFSFQSYDAETRTVVIRNFCPECRKAVIHWCDGSALSLKVSRAAFRRVHGFPGCAMRVAADERCDKQLVLQPSKKSGTVLQQARKKEAPALSASTGEPGKPSEYNRASPGPENDHIANRSEDSGLGTVNLVASGKPV